jgi:hypothetical protein
MLEDIRFLTLMVVDVANAPIVRNHGGDEAVRILIANAFGVVNPIRSNYHGHHLATVGARALFGYTRADDALRSALEMRQGFPEEDDNDEMPILRFGMHTGNVVFADEGCSGETVDIVSRLAVVARPRQVLATEDVMMCLSPGLRVELAELPRDHELCERLGIRIFSGGIPIEVDAWSRVHKPIIPIELESAPDWIKKSAGMSKLEALSRETTNFRVEPKDTTSAEEQKKTAIIRSLRSHGEIPRKAIAEAPPGEVRLVAYCGGTIKILDESKPRLTMGREDANDLVLHLETASRQHGEVQLRDGWFYYVDHSWNGTFIYDEDGSEHLVHHGEYRLKDSGFICPGCPGDAEDVVPVRYKIK